MDVTSADFWWMNPECVLRLKVKNGPRFKSKLLEYSSSFLSSSLCSFSVYLWYFYEVPVIFQHVKLKSLILCEVPENIRRLITCSVTFHTSFESSVGRVIINNKSHFDQLLLKRFRWITAWQTELGTQTGWRDRRQARGCGVP